MQLDDFTSWRQIKSLADKRYVSGVFIWIFALPVAAKLFAQLPETLTVSGFGLEGPVTFDLVLPFSWYVLYLTAIFFSISRLLYLWKCPSFVKTYSNAGDAILRGETVQSFASERGHEIVKHIGVSRNIPKLKRENLKRFLRQLDLNETKDFPYLSIEGAIPNLKKEIKKSLMSVDIRVSNDPSDHYIFENHSRNIKIHRDQLIKHLWADLNRILDVTHPLVRFVSFLFASLGYLTVLWLVIDGFLWVLSSLS